PLRGRDGVSRVWAFLERLEPGGEAGAEDLLRLRWTRPGLTVVISDFLVEDANWAPPLASLRARRQEPILWQVLAPDEERPPLAGDMKLVDVESEQARELTITPGLVGEYEGALAAHRQALVRASQSAGRRFV